MGNVYYSSERITNGSASHSGLTDHTAMQERTGHMPPVKLDEEEAARRDGGLRAAGNGQQQWLNRLHLEGTIGDEIARASLVSGGVLWKGGARFRETGVPITSEYALAPVQAVPFVVRLENLSLSSGEKLKKMYVAFGETADFNDDVGPVFRQTRLCKTVAVFEGLIRLPQSVLRDQAIATLLKADCESDATDIHLGDISHTWHT